VLALVLLSILIVKSAIVANLLKIIFGLYALYAAISSAWAAIHFPAASVWLWTTASLCLLPVAWGIIREKKSAWNAAVGLVAFRFFWSSGQTAGTLLNSSIDRSALLAATLRIFVLNFAISFVLLLLLILARRSYQSAFAPLPDQSSPQKNGYFGPVCLGVLFLLNGLLPLAHPITSSFCPLPLRMIGFGFLALLWTGAAICFLERRWKVIRSIAIIALVMAVLGLLCSLSFYSYFALAGMAVSAIQIILGAAATVTVARAKAAFLN
jgi:hypothetical protein